MHTIGQMTKCLRLLRGIDRRVERHAREQRSRGGACIDAELREYPLGMPSCGEGRDTQAKRQHIVANSPRMFVRSAFDIERPTSSGPPSHSKPRSDVSVVSARRM